MKCSSLPTPGGAIHPLYQTVRVKYPTRTPRLSAGAVIFRLDSGQPRCLLLRAYRLWDFPKGQLEPGETAFIAAQREVREETTLSGLVFPLGAEFRETAPYAGGKVARYYLAVAARPVAHLPVDPILGRPEHHEFRWTPCAEARSLLPPRLYPVLSWACAAIGALLDSGLNPLEKATQEVAMHTGMKDEHYDIVSALYHALQGADVCNKYIEDAQKEGDGEVVSFFHEVQDKNRELAMKAKDLLAKRVH